MNRVLDVLFNDLQGDVLLPLPHLIPNRVRTLFTSVGNEADRVEPT